MDGEMLADMNGALAYWGPSRASTPEPRQELELSVAEVIAFTRLSGTLHGRTWAGTSALMSAVLATAAPELVAA